ncbi:MAG: nucleoside-diphosphate kinase [Candidatus Tectomicrobia bacterium]|uniref:Nucleoside diphosphate kinase n=1 Tax=Tectimicrobiota bacterium TaxID=2528274 RepID=A0A937W2Z0_UNCTE|nr:nucleoside-diphosphate kinase [Candidatus Tectomicrobia bacterium]
MEQTLTIIKPDAVQRNLAGQILARLEAAGFVVLGLKMVQLSIQDAERFYHVHRERPFFASLTAYMASGPAIPIVLQRDNAIQALRDLMGATNPAQAADGTLRKDFGIDVEKNAIHGSDSPASAAQEIPFFFNQLECRAR